MCLRQCKIDHMVRRDFLARFTALLGAFSLPSFISNTKELNSLDTTALAKNPCTFVLKSQPQEITEQIYGKQATQNLRNLRRQYFQSGTLLSLSKVSKKESTSNKIQLYDILVFGSSDAKSAYIKEHVAIFDSAKLSVNKT